MVRKLFYNSIVNKELGVIIMKQCRICGKEFEPVKNGGSRQYCFECVPLGLSSSDRTVYRRRALKRQGVKMLGGKCVCCGESREHVLNFHHIDRENKSGTPANLIKDGEIEQYFDEIRKCILLCSNCHQDFHFRESWEGITLEEYLGQKVITLNDMGKDDINREKTHVKYYCTECGKELYEKTKTGLCSSCYQKTTRVAERPEPKQLAQEIIESSFCAVGRKYGVSDNAIRKWCKTYDIPTKKNELKEWLSNQ